MGRLRARIRDLEQEASADIIAVRHPDGSTSRFHQGAAMECFLHEMDRGRRYYFGEEPGEAHPTHLISPSALSLKVTSAPLLCSPRRPSKVCTLSTESSWLS